MPTVKDVSKLAGVSTTTVSIVVNGQADKKRISKKTREKVLWAVKELNYTPNLSARKLRGAKNKELNIGIFWAADTRAAIINRVIQGVQKAKVNSDYSINIVICPFENGKIHKEKNLYTPFHFDGAIIATASITDMEFLQNNKPFIPVVLFNRQCDEFSSVGVDNKAVGSIAFDILKNSGAKSIAIAKIDNDDRFLSMATRRKAFQEKSKENKIIISDIISAKNSLEGGTDIASKLIQSPLPNAIFCDSDFIAQGILNFFLLNNIKVGEDVSILSIGFSEAEISKHTIPSLSIIDIPYEDIAEKSIQVITDIILNGTKQTSNFILPFKIHLRQSCR